MNSLGTISQNVQEVEQRIKKAAERSGRDWENIKLVVVVKNAEVTQIQEAIRAGIREFGENKAQDLLRKISQLPSGLCWHFVGHLQTNKVRQVVPIVELIHSVDSVNLMEEINKRASQFEKEQQILIQVNVSGERSKFGIGYKQVMSFLEKAMGFGSIRVRGLMTIGPLVEDPEHIRPVFAKLREIYNQILSSGIVKEGFDYLSMGMTNDFEVAIEEGANIVRIGTAIFKNS